MAESLRRPRFNQAIFELIGIKPRASRSALKLLEKRERECGLSFPASVREWYSLGSPALLRAIGCGKTADELLPVRELGRPFPNWYGKPNADFVRAGLLVFMIENQGVCNWAVELDGGDDPRVVVDRDSSGKAKSLVKIRWQRCAESFSTFMYCRAWDHGHSLKPIRVSLVAQDRPLVRRDLERLRAHFSEGPRTYGHPGMTNYRFLTEGGTMLIWDGEQATGDADWFVMASSEPALERMLRWIWRCGTLAETLTADDAHAQAILDRQRSRAHGGRRPKR